MKFVCDTLQTSYSITHYDFSQHFVPDSFRFIFFFFFCFSIFLHARHQQRQPTTTTTTIIYLFISSSFGYVNFIKYIADHRELLTGMKSRDDCFKNTCWFIWSVFIFSFQCSLEFVDWSFGRRFCFILFIFLFFLLLIPRPRA